MALLSNVHRITRHFDCTPETRASAPARAHQSYATFLHNGIKEGGLTQAMADGPLALTPEDSTWLTATLELTPEERFKGFWTGL